MDELTTDDLYEIEKIVDNYAGTVANRLGEFCKVAIHFDAVKDASSHGNPLNLQIEQLSKTQLRMTEIREKLEKMRKNHTPHEV